MSPGRLRRHCLALAHLLGELELGAGSPWDPPEAPRGPGAGGAEPDLISRWWVEGG